MKNVIKLLGVISMVLIIGLSMASCGGDDGGGGTGTAAAVPTSVTYEAEYGTNSYKLVITKAAEGRAVQPANGDTYVLTITVIATGSKTESRGTVTETTSTSIKLTPDNGTQITVTIAKTATATLIKGITGSIDGTNITLTNMTPVIVIPKHKLVAVSNDAGQAWTSEFLFSDLTDIVPSNGDTFEVKISGTSDTAMNKFFIMIGSWSDEESAWLGLAHSDEMTISKDTPFEETIQLNKGDDPKPGYIFRLYVQNKLWNPGSGYNYGKLPDDTPDWTTMATIKDFRISLTKVN